MRYVVIVLCSLISNTLFFCSATGQPSRMQLLRQLEAIPAPQQAAPPAAAKPTEKVAEPVIQASPKPPRPPVPAMPAKPNDLTRDQGIIFDLIASCATQLKNPVTYAAAADKLRTTINGKLIGTDPRTIIAQRSELQTALLSAVLGSLMKKDLRAAKAAGTLTEQQLQAAITAGQDMHEEVNIKQWQALAIDQNAALKEQYLNAQDDYNEYEEEPLAPSDTSLLSALASAATTVAGGKTLAGGAAGIAAAVGTLVKGWKTYKERKLAKTQAGQEVLDKLTTLPDTTIDLTKDQKEQIDAIEKDITEEIAPQVLNPNLASEIKQDIAENNSPLGQIKLLAKELAVILYQDPAAFTQPKGNVLNTQFLAVPGAVNELMVRVAHMNTLLTNALIQGTPENQTLLLPTTQQYLLPLFYVPDDFFNGIKNMLSAKTLSPSDRDTFVTQMVLLLTTIQKNKFSFGVAAQYDGKTLDALIAQYNDLSLGSGEESSVYSKLQTLLLQAKAALLAIAQSHQLPAPFSTQPVDAAGAPLTFAMVATQRPADSAKKPNEVYAAILKDINDLIKTNKATIIASKKLYLLLLDGPTLINATDVSVEMRRKMGDPAQMATNLFFDMQKNIQATIMRDQGKTPPISGMSVLDQEILKPLYAFLDLIYADRTSESLTLKQNLFSIGIVGSSNDAINAMIKNIQDFTALISPESRPDVIAELNSNVALHDALYTPLLAIPADFFSMAQKISNDQTRYLFSQVGYCMIEALLKQEPEANNTQTQLLRLKTGFKSISFTPKETDILSTLQESIKKSIETLTALASAPDDKLPDLIRQYTANMLAVKSLLGSSDGRFVIGFNYFANMLFFVDDGIFITTISDKLDADGLKATTDVIQAVLDNPSDLNYTSHKNSHSVEYTLKKMLEDARKITLKHANELSKDASELNTLLNTTFPNLKSRGTYTQALITLYSAVKDGNSRKLIGDNKILYNAFFSQTGVFCLPEGISVDTPATAGLDALAVQAGFTLFDCLKSNPNDLNCDDMAKALIAKMLAFFTTLKNGVLNSDPAAAALATNKVASTAPATTGTDNATSDPSSATAQAATQLLSFLKDSAGSMINPAKELAFAKTLLTHIDDAKERKLIAQTKELSDYFFSADCILVEASALPSYIPPVAVQPMIDVYEEIRDNPNDFGYKGNLIISQKIKAILEALNKIQKRIEDPLDNYEDLGSYEYEQTDKTTGRTISGKGFINKGFQMLTGSVDDPADVLGPKIKPESLIANGWTTRQIDLYNFFYTQGYKDLRSPFMSQFVATLTILDGMCKQLDSDESMPFMRSGRLSKQAMQNRRLLNKLPLELAFHTSVVGLRYLPNDVTAAQWKDSRITAIKFYQYLADNVRKFEMKQEQEGRIKVIKEWLADPNYKATDRVQDAVASGNAAALQQQQIQQMQTMGMPVTTMGMPMMNGMVMNGGVGSGALTGMAGSIYGKSGAQQATLASKGGMMGGIGMMGAGMYGMNPMMGANGMMTGGGMYGMNPMMTGAGMMPGMYGMQSGVDVQSQVQLALLQNQVSDLKTQNAIQSALGGRAPAAQQQQQSALSLQGGQGAAGALGGFNGTPTDVDEISDSENSNPSALNPWDYEKLNRTETKAVQTYKDTHDDNLAHFKTLAETLTTGDDNSITDLISLIRELLVDSSVLSDPYIQTMWQIRQRYKAKPDDLYKALFSSAGLIPNKERLKANLPRLSSDTISALNDLYTDLIKDKTKLTLTPINTSELTVIQREIQAVVDSQSGDNGSDASSSSDSSSDSSSGGRDPVSSLTTFFTQNSANLLDPLLAGQFARQALDQIKQGWFSKRWTNITSLKRSNAGYMQANDTLHNSIFSADGLLKSNQEFRDNLNKRINSRNLKDIVALYQYIFKNPGLVGISNEPQNKNAISNILTWLNSIQTNENYDPNADDAATPDTSSQKTSQDSLVPPTVPPASFARGLNLADQAVS